MDTQNDALEKLAPLKNGQLLVSMSYLAQWLTF